MLKLKGLSRVFMGLNFLSGWSAMAEDASPTPTASCEAFSLNKELNARFEAVANPKEMRFWAEHMNHASVSTGPSESELQSLVVAFASDAAALKRVDEELQKKDLSDWERRGLEGWRAYFDAHTMNNPEAQSSWSQLLEMEKNLTAATKTYDYGYVDAAGQRVELNAISAALSVRNNPDADARERAFGSLRGYEKHILANGWIEIVKKRNEVAKQLGFKNFYEWKLKKTEGLSVEKLFSILDEFEEATRDLMQAQNERVVAENNAAALEPFNYGFATGGSLSRETDPYFRFENSLEIWLRDFAAMKVDMRNALISIDLLRRKGKYPNGFCHMERPTLLNDKGELEPAVVNFACNAVIGATGSGRSTLTTFLHEGGHAANFANVEMPAYAHGQEFAPTSIALAEVQSMFMDTNLDDPLWLTTYARDASGAPMPQALLEKVIFAAHQNRVNDLRMMLIVPYFEKAIYEMSDEELTVDKVLATARATEKKLLLRENGSARPLLTVPHIFSNDTSAYFHGYFLAKLGVYQSREHFMKRDGYIVGNPAVGPEMARVYWAPGNSIRLFEGMKALTGEEFSSRAAIREVTRSRAEILQAIDAAYRHYEKSKDEPLAAMAHNPINARLRIVDGDTLVASNEDGSSAEDLVKRFRDWAQALPKNP